MHDPAPHRARLVIQVLRAFELLRDGQRAEVPTSVQRLLALLALRGRSQRRQTVAGVLWADTSDERAAANLRTTLWRARRIDEGLIHTRADYLELGPDVVIDLTDAHRRADDASTVGSAGRRDDLRVNELLPEWYDDWVLIERERLRQMQLHELERVCHQLSEQHEHARAIEAGIAAVAAEPLRESAQRALIAAHLAEGNVSEAVRQYDAFAEILADALGIEPSPSTQAMVAGFRRSGARAASGPDLATSR